MEEDKDFLRQDSDDGSDRVNGEQPIEPNQPIKPIQPNDDDNKQ